MASLTRATNSSEVLYVKQLGNDLKNRLMDDLHRLQISPLQGPQLLLCIAHH